jgi:hypothetical protein
MARTERCYRKVDLRTLVEIYRLYDAHFNYSEIAEKTGIHPATVRYQFVPESEKDIDGIRMYLGEFREVIATIGFDEGVGEGISLPSPGMTSISISTDNILARMLWYMKDREYPVTVKKMAKHLETEGDRRASINDYRCAILFGERMNLIKKEGGSRVNKYMLTSYGKSVADRTCPPF